MKEKIKELFKQYYNDETMPVVELEDKVLALFDVVWQSEQLCEGLHSTDFHGKCFKCGEQVFVREPK
jgi:hypothetical protein